MHSVYSLSLGALYGVAIPRDVKVIISLVAAIARPVISACIIFIIRCDRFDLPASYIATYAWCFEQLPSILWLCFLVLMVHHFLHLGA